MDKSEFLKLLKECIKDGSITFSVEANGYKRQQFDVSIDIRNTDEYATFKVFSLVVEL